jgi:hypothetical protein
MKKIHLFSILILMLMMTGQSPGQDFFNESEQPNRKTIQVIGDKIYYSEGNDLSIGEFSSDSNFRVLGKLGVGSKMFGLKVASMYAYAALGRNGFIIVDIRSVESPVVVYRNSGMRAFDVDVARNMAYVAGGVEGLRVFNVTNPRKPVQTGFLVDWSDIYKIFVQGKFVYASSSNDGIHVIDVFDPLDPITVCKLDTPVNNSIVKIEGNNAYIAEHENGLQVYDISLPSKPKKIGSLKLEKGVKDVFVLGGNAYLTDGEHRLTKVNIRDAENPVIEEFFETGKQGGGIYVRNGYAYISDGSSGISVVRLSNEPPLPIIADDASSAPPAVEETSDFETEEIQEENISNEEPVIPPANWDEIRRFAVVVGVSEYRNNDIPDLDFADDDAIAFHKFLLSPNGGGFKNRFVKLLVNENATTQNLRDALFNFLKRARVEDLVYIYFSGHGAPEALNPDNMYFITYDTDIARISSTAFPMWDIQTSLERHIAANKVLIIADACHSGGVGEEIKTKSIKSQNLINRYLMELSKSKSGRVCLTASESGELSAESEKWGGGHGVYTHYLLEALKGEADKNKDRIVSVGEVIDYTYTKVTKATKSRQHPDFAGKFDRNMPMSIRKQ